MLKEVKSMVEEELAVSRAWRDQVDRLEEENLQLESQLRHLELVLQLLSPRVRQIGAVPGCAVPFCHGQLLVWPVDRREWLAKLSGFSGHHLTPTGHMGLDCCAAFL